jgi:tetratricopeptide (TPR) repeat protein
MKALALVFGLFTAAFAARALDPQVAMLIARGDAEMEQRHTRNALATFSQAEQIDPKDPAVLLRLSKEYSDLVEETRSEEAAQKALDYAKRALQSDPKIAKAHLNLAVCYGHLTDFVGNKTKVEYSRFIKDEVDRSIALDPVDPFAWYVLGRWHYQLANLNGVLKAMATMIYGGLPAASNEEAVKCFHKSADLAPTRIIHHSALARSYAALGKTDLARQEWRNVLALKPICPDEETDRKEAQRTLKAAETLEIR